MVCILEALYDLSAGDCFNYVGDFNLSKTDCSDAHDAEVLDLVDMPAGPYPSEVGVDAFAIENCPFAMDNYIGPSIESWEQGDREIVCVDE